MCSEILHISKLESITNPNLVFFKEERYDLFILKGLAINMKYINFDIIFFQ